MRLPPGSLRWLAVAGCFLAGAATAQPAPERATGSIEKHAVTTRHDMVVAEDVRAVDAGVAMLRAGGGAIDAAIATQLVLNLVEPQSSGIGGGAFLVYWAAGEKRVETFDGRETAPASAKPDRFLGADGKPLPFFQAVVGGKSVGVPGVLRMLELAHKKHGKLPWAKLFEPAIQLADEGFLISPRLHGLLSDERYLKLYEPARSYFYRPDGTPKPIGTRLVNKALADTFRTLAAEGPDAFYKGAIGRDVVEAVAHAEVSPGDLSESDLAAYKAEEREAVCGPYRVYRVCSMGPPSSGGIAVLEILGILSRFDLKGLAPPSAEGVHLFAEAGRLAYADRDRYVADPAFARVPTKGMIDPAYIATRARLVDPAKSMGRAEPGEPPGSHAALQSDDRSPELPSTSQISIVDKDGDAVSMTTTIENQFGSRMMVRGFLLNNQLTDFSFAPEQDGKPIANRVEAGKRPRSSISPVLVFDGEGRLKMVVGSPGGPTIINYVAKTIVAALDWDLDMQQAADLLNFGNRNGLTEIEEDPMAKGLAEKLAGMGHQTRILEQNSGVHGILVRDGKLEGGADRRREGVARGD